MNIEKIKQILAGGENVTTEFKECIDKVSNSVYEATDDRLTFLVTIPVHESCNESSETNGFGSERGSETKESILGIVKQNPQVTTAEIAMRLNMSSRGVEKQIRKLREEGKIKRMGGRFGGYWEILI